MWEMSLKFRFGRVQHDGQPAPEPVEEGLDFVDVTGHYEQVEEPRYRAGFYPPEEEED